MEKFLTASQFTSPNYDDSLVMSAGDHMTTEMESLLATPVPVVASTMRVQRLENSSSRVQSSSGSALEVSHLVSSMNSSSDISRSVMNSDSKGIASAHIRLSTSGSSIENPRYGGSNARESRGLSIEEGCGGAMTGATAANILDLSVDVSRGSLGLLPNDIIADTSANDDFMSTVALASGRSMMCNTGAKSGISSDKQFLNFHEKKPLARESIGKEQKETKNIDRDNNEPAKAKGTRAAQLSALLLGNTSIFSDDADADLSIPEILLDEMDLEKFDDEFSDFGEPDNIADFNDFGRWSSVCISSEQEHKLEKTEARESAEDKNSMWNDHGRDSLEDNPDEKYPDQISSKLLIDFHADEEIEAARRDGRVRLMKMDHEKLGDTPKSIRNRPSLLDIVKKIPIDRGSLLDDSSRLSDIRVRESGSEASHLEEIHDESNDTLTVSPSPNLDVDQLCEGFSFSNENLFNNGKDSGSVDISNEMIPRLASCYLTATEFMDDSSMVKNKKGSIAESRKNQNGSTVYLNECGEWVTELAYMTAHSFDVDAAEFSNFGEEDFKPADTCLAMLDEDEKQFQAENVFQQDFMIPPSGNSHGAREDSWSMYPQSFHDWTNDLDASAAYMRLSMGTFIGSRTETLGTLDGKNRAARPTFGTEFTSPPSNRKPVALLPQEKSTDKIDEEFQEYGESRDDTLAFSDLASSGNPGKFKLAVSNPLEMMKPNEGMASQAEYSGLSSALDSLKLEHLESSIENKFVEQPGFGSVKWDQKSNPEIASDLVKVPDFEGSFKEKKQKTNDRLSNPKQDSLVPGKDLVERKSSVTATGKEVIGRKSLSMKSSNKESVGSSVDKPKNTAQVGRSSSLKLSRGNSGSGKDFKADLLSETAHNKRNVQSIESSSAAYTNKAEQGVKQDIDRAVNASKLRKSAGSVERASSVGLKAADKASLAPLSNRCVTPTLQSSCIEEDSMMAHEDHPGQPAFLEKSSFSDSASSSNSSTVLNITEFVRKISITSETESEKLLSMIVKMSNAKWKDRTEGPSVESSRGGVVQPCRVDNKVVPIVRNDPPITELFPDFEDTPKVSLKSKSSPKFKMVDYSESNRIGQNPPNNVGLFNDTNLKDDLMEMRRLDDQPNERIVMGKESFQPTVIQTSDQCNTPSKNKTVESFRNNAIEDHWRSEAASGERFRSPRPSLIMHRSRRLEASMLSNNDFSFMSRDESALQIENLKSDDQNESSFSDSVYIPPEFMRTLKPSYQSATPYWAQTGTKVNDSSLTSTGKSVRFSKLITVNESVSPRKVFTSDESGRNPARSGTCPQPTSSADSAVPQNSGHGNQIPQGLFTNANLMIPIPKDDDSISLPPYQSMPTYHSSQYPSSLDVRRRPNESVSRSLDCCDSSTMNYESSKLSAVPPQSWLGIIRFNSCNTAAVSIGSTDLSMWLFQQRDDDDIGLESKVQRLHVSNLTLIPDVCCVGLKMETLVPLSNPNSSWATVDVRVVALTIEGQARDVKTTLPFLTKDRLIIGPLSNGALKVTFSPLHPGLHEVQMCLYIIHPSTGERSTSQIVRLQAMSERPDIEVYVPETGTYLDFGALPWGCQKPMPVTLINRGRAAVPIKMTVSSSVASKNCFFFAHYDGDATNADLSLSLSRSVVLQGQSKGEATYEPLRVMVLFRSPQQTTTGNIPTMDFAGGIELEVDKSCIITHLGSIKLIAHSGTARLHTPEKMDILHLKAENKQSFTYVFPLRNAGLIPLDISLEVLSCNESFSISPAQVMIEPGGEFEISATFHPKGLPSETKLESVLLMVMEPDGPAFEIPLVGEVLHDTRPHPAPGNLLSNKSYIAFGGAAISKSINETLALKNSNGHTLKMVMEIKGSPDFKIVSLFGRKEKLCTSKSIIIKGNEEFPVHLKFTPSDLKPSLAKLHIRAVDGNGRYSIPLSGYGGQSHLVIDNLRPAGDHRYYAASLKDISDDRRQTAFATLRNKGSRTAFVKGVAFKDAACKILHLGDSIRIEPNEFCLKAGDTQKLVMRYTEDPCHDLPSPVAYVRLFYGDEVSRQLYKRAVSGSNQTDSMDLLSIDDPVRSLIFNSRFEGEELIDEGSGFPETKSDVELFYQSLTKVTISLVLPPKPKSAAYCGSGSQKSAVMSSGQDFKSQPVAPSALILPVRSGSFSNRSESPPVRGSPIASEVESLSRLNRNSESADWSIEPDQLTLICPALENVIPEVKSLVISNRSDAQITYHMSWPAHCIVVSEEHGTIPARSSFRVDICANRELKKKRVALPWSGTIQVHQRDDVKTVNVRITGDYLTGNPTQSLPAQIRPGELSAQMRPGELPAQMRPGELPASDVPQIPALRMNRPVAEVRSASVNQSPSTSYLPISNQSSSGVHSTSFLDIQCPEFAIGGRERRDSLFFPITLIGQVSDMTICLSNASTTPVNWSMKGFTPVYLQPADSTASGHFRVLYEVFKSKQTKGFIPAKDSSMVRIRFAPREFGMYSQVLDVAFVSGMNAEDQFVCHLQLHGKGSKDAMHLGAGEVSSIDSRMDSKLTTASLSVQSIMPSFSERPLPSGDEILTWKPSTLDFLRSSNLQWNMQKLELRNKGERDLQIEILPLRSPFHCSHSQVNIRSRHFMRLPVEFKPTQSGVFYAVLVLKCPTENKTYTIQITGESG